MCQLCDEDGLQKEATHRCFTCTKTRDPVEFFCEACYVEGHSSRLTRGHDGGSISEMEKIQMNPECSKHGIPENSVCLEENIRVCEKCHTEEHKTHPLRNVVDYEKELIGDLLASIQEHRNLQLKPLIKEAENLKKSKQHKEGLLKEIRDAISVLDLKLKEINSKTIKSRSTGVMLSKKVEECPKQELLDREQILIFRTRIQQAFEVLSSEQSPQSHHPAAPHLSDQTAQTPKLKDIKPQQPPSDDPPPSPSIHGGHRLESNRECEGPTSHSSNPLPLPKPQKPGNWICTSCLKNNFAATVHCFKCRTKRPHGAPDLESDRRQKVEDSKSQQPPSSPTKFRPSSSLTGSQSQAQSQSQSRHSPDQRYQGHKPNDNKGHESGYAVHFCFGRRGPGRGEFNAPRGLALDSSGNIFVADSKNHRIQVFQQSDAKLLRTIGYRGNFDGEFEGPCDLAIDADGNLIVVDEFHHCIQTFYPSGKYRSKLGARGTGDGRFMNPHGVAISREGDIIIADMGNHRIQIYTRVGSWSKFGTLGASAGQMSSPCAVAVDPTNGNIFVCERGNRRVQVFLPNGESLRIIPEFVCPSGVAVKPNGDFAVTDRGFHQVQVYSKEFKIITKFGQENLNCPSTPIILGNENIAFAETGNNRVQIYAKM